MKTLLKITLMFSLIGMSAWAKADDNQEQMDINTDTLEQEIYYGGQKIKSGDTEVFVLNPLLTIDRVAIETDKAFLCGHTSLRVTFDGGNARSIEITKESADETTHILDVRAIVSTVEVQNYGPCTVTIKKITALPRRLFEPRHNGCGYSPCSAAGQAQSMVSYLLEMFRALDRLVADQDRIQVISEGKKVFGRAQAVLASNPETSSKAREAIEETLDFLQSNQDFIQELQTIEVTFQLATQIQQISEMLERMSK